MVTGPAAGHGHDHGSPRQTTGHELWEVLHRMEGQDEQEALQDLSQKMGTLEAKRKAALDEKHAQQLNKRLHERVAVDNVANPPLQRSATPPNAPYNREPSPRPPAAGHHDMLHAAPARPDSQLRASLVTVRATHDSTGELQSMGDLHSSTDLSPVRAEADAGITDSPDESPFGTGRKPDPRAMQLQPAKPMLMDSVPMLADHKQSSALAVGVPAGKAAGTAPAAITVKGGADAKDNADAKLAGKVQPPAAKDPRLEREDTVNSTATYDDIEDLSQYSWPRQWALRICTNPDFELFVILVIVANCLTLAMYNPMKPEEDKWNRTIFWFEAAFNGIFSLEVVLRVISLGAPFFWTYIKHPWNMFDFAMVLAGYTAFIPTGSSNTGGIRALRAMRALRPLRSITRFEALRSIVVCFLEAIPLVGAVVALLVFVMLIFAIAGTAMFMNVYRDGCFHNVTNAPEVNQGQLDASGCGGWRECPANYTCVNTDYSQNINEAGYENVGYSLLTVFQIISLTGWEYIMYRSIHNTSPFAVIYYALLIFLIGYIMLNLFLAVLKVKFAKAQTVFHAKKQTLKSKARRNSIAMLFSKAKSKISEFQSKRSQANSLNMSIASMIHSKMSQMSEREDEQRGPGENSREGMKAPKPAAVPPVANGDTVPAAAAGVPQPSGGSSTTLCPIPAGGASKSRTPMLGSPAGSDRGAGAAGAGAGVRSTGGPVSEALENAEGTPRLPHAVSGRFPGGLKSSIKTPRTGSTPMGDKIGATSMGRVPRLGSTVGGQSMGPGGVLPDASMAMMVMSVSEFDEFTRSMPTMKRTWLRIQFRLRVLVNNNIFNQFFLLAIVVNTILLAMEYDGMSEGMQSGLETANMVLTILFSAELAVKVLGLGIWDYISDAFNVFDAIVVAVSLVELGVSSAGGLNALRSMRILKAFRVLRLFKMFRYLQSLRKIGEVLVTSFTSFAAIALLIVLFWIVFAIIGLHVFGGLVDKVPPAVYGFPNFNTFINSLMSTLLILTSENYQYVMYDTIRATNYGSSLFFVFWIVIGKYILLTLFLAVTLEAFESRYEGTSTRGGMTGNASSWMTGLRSKMSGMTGAISQSMASLQNSVGSVGKASKGVSVRKPSAARGGRSPPGSPRGGLRPKEALAKAAAERAAKAGRATASSNGAAAVPALGKLEDLKERVPVGAVVAVVDQPGDSAEDRQGGVPVRRMGSGLSPAVTARTPTPPNGARAMGEGVEGDGGAEDPYMAQYQQEMEQARARRGFHAPAPQRPVSHSPGAAVAAAVMSGMSEFEEDRGGEASLLGRSAQPLHQPQPHAAARRQSQGPTYLMSRSGITMTHDSAATTGASGDSGVQPLLQDVEGTAVRRASGLRSVGDSSPSAMAPKPPSQGLPGPGGRNPHVRTIPDPTAMPMYDVSAATEFDDEAGDLLLDLPAAGQSGFKESLLLEEFGFLRGPKPETPLADGDPGLHKHGAAQHVQGPSPVTLPTRPHTTQEHDQHHHIHSHTLHPHPPQPRAMTPLARPGTAANLLPSDLHITRRNIEMQRVVMLNRPPSTQPGSMLATGSLPGGRRWSMDPDASGVLGAGKGRGKREAPESVNNASVAPAVALASTTTAPASPSTPQHQASSDQGKVQPGTAAAFKLPLGQEVRSTGADGMALSDRAKEARRVKLAVDHDDGEDGGKGPKAMASRHSTNLSAGLSEIDSVLSGHQSKAGGASGSTAGGDSKHAAGGDAAGAKKHHHARNRPDLIPLEGVSFGLVPAGNKVRKRVYNFVTHLWCDYFMFAIILANCVFMALENPNVDEESKLGRALYWSNIGFTAIFTVEALMKIFAFTFILYIKKPTNVVDLLIVLTSLLEITLTAINLSIVGALRVLRVFKPLRVMTRSHGMRLVFKSVTLSLAAMANVSIVVLLAFLVFAILGVQLFSGMLYSCNDGSVPDKASCNGTYIIDPVTNETAVREWSNTFPNFDNTGQALLTCFVTATLNGYVEVMEATMAAPSVKGEQSQRNQNPGAFFWFVGFIFIGSFTLLNLYVGVIFNQFSRIRLMSTTGSAFLTQEQQEWAELSRMVFKLKPPEKSQIPKGVYRRAAYRLINSTVFDVTMMLVILANVATMMTDRYGESEEEVRNKEKMNIIFTSIFTAEMLIKFFALGVKRYFKDKWNRLDFALVMLSLLDLAIAFMNATFVRVLRVLRVQRLLRLVRVLRFVRIFRDSKGVKSLFTTLVVSLPAFGNVGALIGLFFFMYAYVGVLLFANVKHQEALDDTSNFDNFLFALMALFRVATGDNWSDLMIACMIQEPDCSKEEGNCGSFVAIPYFLTFVLLITIVLLNLFTAVVIENFEKQHEQEEWRLNPENLEEFANLWSEYDDGTGTIAPKALEELLLRLDPPLGLGAFADNKDVLRFVYDLDIPLVNFRVPFHKTAFELVRRCSQANIPEGALKEQIDHLVEKFFKDLNKDDEQMNFSAAVSVMLIQRKWRTRMRAHRLRRLKEWRRSRSVNIPKYVDIMEGKAQVIQKYKDAAAKALAAMRKPKSAPTDKPSALPSVPEGTDVPEPKTLADAFTSGVPAPGPSHRPGAGARMKQGAIRWRWNAELTPFAPHDIVAATSAATEQDQGVMGRLGRMLGGIFGGGKGTLVQGILSPRSPRTAQGAPPTSNWLTRAITFGRGNTLTKGELEAGFRNESIGASPRHGGARVFSMELPRSATASSAHVTPRRASVDIPTLQHQHVKDGKGATPLTLVDVGAAAAAAGVDRSHLDMPHLPRRSTEQPIMRTSVDEPRPNYVL